MGKEKDVKKKRVVKVPGQKRKVVSSSKKHSSLNGMVVSEPGSLYYSTSDNSRGQVLDSVLFKGGSGPEHMLTSLEKSELVEGGITKKDLERLKEQANLDYDQLSKVLNVARATLINKKGNDAFRSDVSDKILNLADIYSYGYEVFGEREKFNNWVFRNNKALGGQSPYDLLHNSFGRQEVKNLIGRIDHGIYS